jgi:hypothetical protein
MPFPQFLGFVDIACRFLQFLGFVDIVCLFLQFLGFLDIVCRFIQIIGFVDNIFFNTLPYLLPVSKRIKRLKSDATSTDASTAGRKEKPRKKRTSLREKCDAAKHSDESTTVLCAPHKEDDLGLAKPGADSETLYDVTAPVSSVTDTETVARAVCTTAGAVCTTAGEEKGAWAAGGGPEDKWQAGERILCFHGPLIYEAKIQQVGVPFL